MNKRHNFGMTKDEEYKYLQLLFNQKIERSDNCWNWKGNILRGRALFSFKHKKMTVQNFSWLIHKGERAPDSIVLQSCNNHLCSNPDHLYLGSKKQMAQKTSKNKKVFGQVLNTSQVFEIRELLKTATKQTDIAEIYGVSNSTISDIKHKRSWHYI
jgi:hypothetical protein